MKLEAVLLQLLEQIKNDDWTDESRANVKDLIQSSASDRTLNPRDKTDGNEKLLKATVFIALGTATDMYGVGDETKLYPIPFFERQPQSQIAPLMDDMSTVGIVLGECVRSWEEVFYDICHESLHLLDPIINVYDSNVKVSALEEGVAVKFAEDMYEQYVRPYCRKKPLTSPVSDINSQYFKAYSAAKKIPDVVLKDVRKVFGKFSKIDDVEKFKEMVGNFISDEDVKTLVDPFVYTKRLY